MFQPFHTRLRNLYSNGANGPARRTSARRSSAWAAPRTGCPWLSLRSPVECADGHGRGVSCAAIALTHRDNRRRPKSFSSASVWSLVAGALTWRQPGLGYPPRARALPVPNPAYPPKYGVFGPLFSCRHHSREAPLFSRLDALTV